jgi:quinol-cytochrome oxidoreductase complex cytochrome b subunit
MAHTDVRTGAAAPATAFKPVPVWFFAFEGLMGASYDVVKTAPYGWVVLAAGLVVNVALARTVLRGRLKMARAILKGKRTRVLAVGLIALRVALHAVLGVIGMQATSPVAHACFAVLMCASTVALLAFDQKVMLKALDEQAAGTAGPVPAAPTARPAHAARAA